MKLEARKFGIACAVAAAILWVICSLFVMAMPLGMMNMSGSMMHGDYSGMQWHMGLSGLIVGLIAWPVVAGFSGWLVAFIYNKL